MGLSKFIRDHRVFNQREYELIHIERSIRGHTISCNVWDFEPGKGFSIKRYLTIKLLIICWLPPFLVTAFLCVLHLLHPDKGLGDLLSLLGAALSALAAWIPGIALKGWQLNDAVRGKYYTTNLDTAHEVSKSKVLKLIAWYPSIRKPQLSQEAHLEPATLLVVAIRRGDARVVGSGGCYFNLLGGRESFFSPLEIRCDRGVPLEVVVIATNPFSISEFKRQTEVTVHLEPSWQANLPRLEILLSKRSNPYKQYTKNGQLGGSILDHDGTTTRIVDRKTSKSRFGESYSYDVYLLTQALRGGKNLLLASSIQTLDRQMV